MVNSKQWSFKVDRQTLHGAAPQPISTVINCRVSRTKRACGDEVQSQQVPLSKVVGSQQAHLPKFTSAASPSGTKRKRIDEGEPKGAEKAQKLSSEQSASTRPFPLLRPPPKPTKFRKGKVLSRGIDLDCWFTILSFSDPAQLLEMRTKIASCYRFLRDTPTLWKHSRTYYYGGLPKPPPNPPSELTEFQYADLRHGHGCMSCGAKSTRKTYWAFLRRWCKPCARSKFVKEADAASIFKDQNGEDLSFLQKFLPSGTFDSWGNFVGVGPAHANSLKTVFLVTDARKIVADYIQASQQDPATWPTEMHSWTAARAAVVEERRHFAKLMEDCETDSRNTRTEDYLGKKTSRMTYFIEKAAQLTPPIRFEDMKDCAAFKRAIAIPKEPNMTSWSQLKPKLIKEVAELREKRNPSVACPDTSPGTPDHTTPAPLPEIRPERIRPWE